MIGEREWMYGLLPWYRVTQPQPFTRMPLVYERAFGGDGHLANPDGCGYARGRLPGSPAATMARCRTSNIRKRR